MFIRSVALAPFYFQIWRKEKEIFWKQNHRPVQRHSPLKNGVTFPRVLFTDKQGGMIIKTDMLN